MTLDPVTDRARATAETVARRSYGKLVAFVAARTRDVAGAEDALSEAFATALRDWPQSGVPDNPEAWLLTVARRKTLDALRRRATQEESVDQLHLAMEELADAAAEAVEIPDERLRLMFACAHPAIDPAIRAPLILQTILGFDAVAIASAFLISPATMGQRLVRAKAKIRLAGIPFRVPERTELAERLDAVLEAIYAAFAEGWADATGGDARRRELAEEAIWLGRLVASLMPEQPEALGLLALMLHAEARRGARRQDGRFVPLGEQDTTRWDATMIDEAEACLARAGTFGQVGRYQIEAAIQSAHAARRLDGRTDWMAIAALYEGLFALTASPVVAINHAVALSQAQGVEAGLTALSTLDNDTRMRDFQPYWAVRAEFLAKCGKPRDADEAYERAIGLETDPAVRTFLEARRATCATAAKGR